MPELTHTLHVGSIACTVLHDGSSPRSKEDVLRLLPAPQDELTAAFADLGIDIGAGTLPNSLNLLLIQQGDDVLLVDTGMGASSQPRYGKLVAALDEAGFTPEQVTQVFLSHLHGDHYLGLLNAEGGLQFPNAIYSINRLEWQHWIDEGNMPQEQRGPLNAIADRLRKLEAGAEIVPGVTLIAAYGHTPGHTGLLVESGGQKFFHAVDMLHMPVQFAHPEWSLIFDSDSSVSVPTRRRLLQHAAEENWLTLFYHLPFPGLGTVQPAGAAYKFVEQA